MQPVSRQFRGFLRQIWRCGPDRRKDRSWRGEFRAGVVPSRALKALAVFATRREPEGEPESLAFVVTNQGHGDALFAVEVQLVPEGADADLQNCGGLSAISARFPQRLEDVLLLEIVE